MTEAKVHRMHKPKYNEEKHPPLPSRIRLAASCWERVWTLMLIDPLDSPVRLDSVVNRFATDSVSIRGQLRTHRRLCIAITTQSLDDQNEFEIAMMIMAQIQKDLGEIERIEDRPAAIWPIEEFI